MYSPLLSRCGRKGRTLGSPAGREAGRVGGGCWLQSKGKTLCVCSLITPFATGVQIAPGSEGALSELAMQPLWR